MLNRNDPQFLELITTGIPIGRLERRLSPAGSRADKSGGQDSFDYSEKGFLGVDESLLDVVYADWLVVEKYGTTHQEIAELLATAIQESKVPNPEYALEFIASTNGVQWCPWGCRKASSDIISIYHNDKKLRPAIVTELHPHLIGDHYFFEGRKTIYRANPEILIPALKSRHFYP